MNSSRNALALHWRRVGVDMLIAAATFAVALAAIGTTADDLYLLLISGLLVAIGLVLEPDATTQPAANAHESKPQAMGHFNATVLDAASV